jgi:uncharacterized membrane protein YkoI
LNNGLKWRYEPIPFGEPMPKLIKTLPSIALSILVMMFAVQSAHSEESPATARKLSASGQILSLEKITKAAKAIKPGDILETELERKHGLYVYEVEILDNKGLVWELKLNAKTGKLIKMEQDD